MCTLSIVPYGRENCRLVFNRDERRTRGFASPPAWHVVGARAALFPRDADAGGTWVGLNDCGLVAMLLNRTDDDASMALLTRGTNYQSRGVVVPRVLEARDLAGAVSLARRLPRGRFRPFRLVLLRGREVVVISASPRDSDETCSELTDPLMLTSSSLGDALVEQPRRRLFIQMMRTSRSERPRAQSRFHAYRWPHRPELGVLMSRPDARTVSRTVCDISPDAWTMTYESITESTADLTRRHTRGAASP